MEEIYVTVSGLDDPKHEYTLIVCSAALQHAINEARFGGTTNLDNPGPFKLELHHLKNAMEMREKLTVTYSQANDTADETTLAQIRHERAARTHN